MMAGEQIASPVPLHGTVLEENRSSDVPVSAATVTILTLRTVPLVSRFSFSAVYRAPRWFSATGRGRSVLDVSPCRVKKRRVD